MWDSFGMSHLQHRFQFGSAALLQPIELEALGPMWDQLCSSVELTQQIFVPKFSNQHEILLMPASCLARVASCCSHASKCFSQTSSCAWEYKLAPCDGIPLLLLSASKLKNGPKSLERSNRTHCCGSRHSLYSER